MPYDHYHRMSSEERNTMIIVAFIRHILQPYDPMQSHMRMEERILPEEWLQMNPWFLREVYLIGLHFAPALFIYSYPAYGVSPHPDFWIVQREDIQVSIADDFFRGLQAWYDDMKNTQRNTLVGRFNLEHYGQNSIHESIERRSERQDSEIASRWETSANHRRFM